MTLSILLSLTAIAVSTWAMMAAFKPRQPSMACLIRGKRIRTESELNTHTHLDCPPLLKGCAADCGGHSCALPEDHDGQHACGCAWGWSW